MNNTEKREHDKQYMKIAKIISSNSHAKKLKVGALIVKDRMIISDGYNGTPAGFPNECEFEAAPGDRLKTRPHVLHAESNAILKLARSTNSGVRRRISRRSSR